MTKAQVDFEALEFNAVSENIFQRPITAMVVDGSGFIWIGTDGAGLYKFNGVSYTYYVHDLADEKSINSNSISSLYVDASGLLWIGTDAGLCFYDAQLNSFERFQNVPKGKSGTNFTNILCFAEHDNRLLVGTYDGVKEVDRENKWLNHHTLSGASVLDLQFSTKGELYIGTNEGLKVKEYLGGGEIVDLPLTVNKSGQQITKLHLDKRENLWVGTLRSGVFKGDLKKARTTFDHLDIVESAIMTITSGMDHVFIAVENEGLVVLDMNGSIIKHYRYDANDAYSIASDSVWAILLDSENRV
ncbi:MAG: two-component regulator propeller domain-containing protein, partial [Bacteroidota bacterium]